MRGLANTARFLIGTMLASAVASAQAPPAGAPISYPRMGNNHEILVGPDTWFRFGFVIQAWLSDLQSPTRVDGSDGSDSLDAYLRRSSFFVRAQLLKNIGAFVLIDTANLGRSTQTGAGTDALPFVVSRSFSPAMVGDAFAEVKLAGDALMISGGLMFVPFSHNGLQANSTRFVLDGSSTAVVQFNAATSAGRDTGFQLKGYEADDRLEWRLFVGSGLRQPATGANPLANNGPRIAAHLQVQLFDVDKGYVNVGHTFGRKKRLGLCAGFDYQKGDDLDAYRAFSAGVFGDWPLSGEARPEGGDEILFVTEYYHYDGGQTFPGVALASQNDLDAEVAYYNKGLRSSIFGKLELQKYSDDANQAANRRWLAGGIKYFVWESYCNLTLFYQRIDFPDADPGMVNGTNQFTLQLQVSYY